MIHLFRLHKIQWFQLWNSRESCPKFKNGQWPYFCYSITGTCRNRSELCRNITGTVRNFKNIASKSRGKIIKAPKISPVLTDFNQFLTDFNLFQPVGIKKLLIIPARVTMAHLNVYDKMDQSKLLLVKVFHIFGEMKLSSDSFWSYARYYSGCSTLAKAIISCFNRFSSARSSTSSYFLVVLV